MLNEHREFSVRDVYLRLDSKQQGCIDATNVRDFLRSRGSRYQDKSHALSFIKAYDSDHDCCLSFVELVKALTPVSSPAMKNMAEHAWIVS